MPALPGSIALTGIVDGSLIVAVDHRNNYNAVQAAVNALIAYLAGLPQPALSVPGDLVLNSDSDASGAGTLYLQTSGVQRLAIDPNGTFYLGANPSWQLDFGGTSTVSLNFRARGAANSKALMRIMPQGSGESATTGDRAEFTLMGTDVGAANSWWADHKVRERPSDNLRFVHFLTDRTGTSEPATEVVFEIDGQGVSAGDERFRIVRNSWIDAAAGDTQVMLDIKGTVGIQGIAQSKIAVNGLKVGPTAAGADISVFLDDGTNRSAFTRQTGANGDLLFRNFGTGNVAIRPNDDAANDYVFGTGGMTFPNAHNIALGTATGTKIGTATNQKLAFYNATPVIQPSGTPAAATDLATVISLANSLRTNLLSLGLVA